MELARAIEQPDRLPRADCHRQVERILQSVAFRNSTTLQQLLEFLTTRSLEGGAEPLKEYTIGVEAFGRPTDFDPKTDTIVRVQIHRLRQKLKEYYDTDGRLDPIFVEIPKGHYLPTFESVVEMREPEDNGILAPQKSVGPNLEDAPGSHNSETGRVPTEGTLLVSQTWFTWKWIVIAASVLAVFAIGLSLGRYSVERPNAQASTVSVQALAVGTDPVKTFWASFVGDDPNPVIAYPDAVFLLDNFNDLFRYRQGASDERGALVDPHLAQQFASNPALVRQAGTLYFENGYTGAGEIQSVAMLAVLFGQMGLHPIIKPSRDITPVDLRQHSVILLGSSFQNVAVAQLMLPGDFQFKNPDPRLEQWRAEITNTTPQPGEATVYHTERDPSTHVLKCDFAIFSVQAGVVPGRHIAVLGGLDTTGTDGATMYATSKSGVEELVKRLAINRKVDGPIAIPQFQALVQVQLEKGYEVLGATLEAVHKINISIARGPEGTP